MSLLRRHYRIHPITINGRLINEVVIDPHYQEKHATYMTDSLAIELIMQLDRRWEVATLNRPPFEYFATLISKDSRQYRVIWLLEHGALFVGLINVFRDN